MTTESGSREYAGPRPVPTELSYRGHQQQATELALLEQGMREVYHKLHEATSASRSSSACLTKHEAAEILKLLQAATKK